MFTVSIAVAPPAVGIFVEGEKENVASEGTPDTPKVCAGIVPVEPETRVIVTVYAALFPLSTVRFGVTVML